jgi:cell division protein FtsL
VAAGDNRRRPAKAGRKRSARADRHTSQARPKPPRHAPPTASSHSLAFTSRAAVLGLAVCVMVLTLAYPFKEYLGQRSQIAAEVSQQNALRADIQRLTAEHQAATDPTQIEQQARARLHYTFPGQKNYIQLAPAAPTKTAPVKAGNATLPTDPGGTWYGKLWTSDQTAGS